MNYLKLKIGLIAILFSVLGISQEAFDATVVGIINVGEQDYSVLNKKGTSDYYKTNLYRKNELSKM